jgi:hypothetical protein
MQEVFEELAKLVGRALAARWLRSRQVSQAKEDHQPQKQQAEPEMARPSSSARKPRSLCRPGRQLISIDAVVYNWSEVFQPQHFHNKALLPNL